MVLMVLMARVEVGKNVHENPGTALRLLLSWGAAQGHGPIPAPVSASILSNRVAVLA